MKKFVLIGFKSSGKTVVGRTLAERMNLDFIDLDDEIVKMLEQDSGLKMSCREIVKKHGEEFFRNLEAEALNKVLADEKPFILAVGGGTPMSQQNQKLLKKHFLIHLVAPKKTVFERIMINGRPSFFPDDQTDEEAFESLWNERNPVFEGLANCEILNIGSMEGVVDKIESTLGRKNILLINGPNLNMLGKRNAEHYGSFSLMELENAVSAKAQEFGFEVKYFQSNHEGFLIDYIQQNSDSAVGIIINPGALTHYSYALHDALLDSCLHCVEVHLSDIGEREDWRRISVTAAACKAIFSGKKLQSYIEGLEFLMREL